MRQIKLTCFIWLLLSYPQLHAQNFVNQLDSITTTLVKSISRGNNQKILLQTNRKVFAAGEKIWFKAFLVKSLSYRLDTSSKNLFVDLVSDNDRVVKQLVLNTVAHQTAGAIDLPDTLQSGYYWLRCFTYDMLEHDTASVVIQPVFIINEKKLGQDGPTQPVSTKTKINVAYYPEGGAVITGINSTGAIKVSDADGNPVVTSGYIVDNHDTVITRFTTNRLGLARATFYPKWFQKYTAVVHTTGPDVKCPVTAWDPFAAQVSVIKQDGESLQAYITLEDSVYTRKYTTYLIAISRDKVCFAGVGRGMCQVNIPLANFPGGIATLLLFNEDKQLVSERKIFIDKDNYRLDVTTDKQNYHAKDRVGLYVSVRDTKGQPLVAALNISVEDDRVMQLSDKLDQDTLPTPTLSLDDWLKRYKQKLSAEEKDLLMLAQPAAYGVATANKIKPATVHKDVTELLLNLKGKIYDSKNNPLPGRIVTEIVKQGNNAFIDVDTTNNEGAFSLRLPEDRGSAPLMLQIRDKRGNLETDFKIVTDTFSFPRFATPVSVKNRFTLAGILPSASVLKYHTDNVFAGVGKEWLAPVSVQTRARKKADPYVNSKRVDPFSHIITSEMIGRGGFGSTADALLMMPGVKMSMGFVTIFGGDGRGGNISAEPMLIVDGVQVTGSNDEKIGDNSPVLRYLTLLPAGDIDFIEVLAGGDAAIYGLRGGNGVIIVSTKNRAENTTNGPSGMKIVSTRTYHVAPTFPMPDYSIKETQEADIIDRRNTIYWNGNVVTDNNGNAAVTFYTADARTTYSVVITGLTANGEYIYKRITINSK